MRFPIGPPWTLKLLFWVAFGAILLAACSESPEPFEVRRFSENRVPDSIWSGEQPIDGSQGVRLSEVHCERDMRRLQVEFTIDSKMVERRVEFAYLLISLDSHERGEFVTGFLEVPLGGDQRAVVIVDSESLEKDSRRRFVANLTAMTIEEPTHCTVHLLGTVPASPVPEPTVTVML